jgi:hypothetical protein
MVAPAGENGTGKTVLLRRPRALVLTRRPRPKIAQFLIRRRLRLGFSYPQLTTVTMFGALLTWAAALCNLHWAVDVATLWFIHGSRSNVD